MLVGNISRLILGGNELYDTKGVLNITNFSQSEEENEKSDFKKI